MAHGEVSAVSAGAGKEEATQGVHGGVMRSPGVF